MANSYLVVQDAFGKSLSLACSECGGISFAVVWESEGPREWDKISAVCTECLERKTLALPLTFDYEAGESGSANG